MLRFIYLTKLTTTGRGAIISGLTFVLVFCQKPSLPKAFVDSSRNEALPHSWEATRRYYLLVQYLQKKGFRRCVAYLPEKECENLPRTREVRLFGKVQTSKRGLVGRILIAETNVDNPAIIYDFTGKKGVLAAEEIEKLFFCLQKKQISLKKMPNLIFYEGDGFLPYVLDNFPKQVPYRQVEKNLCNGDVF